MAGTFLFCFFCDGRTKRVSLAEMDFRCCRIPQLPVEEFPLLSVCSQKTTLLAIKSERTQHTQTMTMAQCHLRRCFFISRFASSRLSTLQGTTMKIRAISIGIATLLSSARTAKWSTMAFSGVTVAPFPTTTYRYRTLVILGASSTDSVLTDEALRDGMRLAYELGETDGIVEFASAHALDQDSYDNFIVTCMDAASQSKGKAAGMINGWIGSCCLMDDEDQGAMMAWRLLEAYQQNQLGLTPDVVTYCLVYSALTRTNQETYHVLANMALERAEQWSKKEGGSKKRRALAASKRNKANPEAADLTPFGIQVLQDTPHFMVVSKPSGMVCFHKRTTTAGKVTKSRVKRQKEGDADNTRMDYSLQDVLLTANIPLSTLNPDCRGLVHRIDRGTSGCIVFAKTNEMHAKMVTEFFLRKAKKSYQAVVVAAKDMPDHGEITSSVGGRPAKSTFVVEDRIHSTYARLRVETWTGRKHQVRVHCAQGLKSPILLDALYGDETLVYPEPIAELARSGQRFFLHASSLQLASFGIDCKAPVPTWWEEAITVLS